MRVERIAAELERLEAGIQRALDSFREQPLQELEPRGWPRLCLGRPPRGRVHSYYMLAGLREGVIVKMGEIRFQYLFSRMDWIKVGVFLNIEDSRNRGIISFGVFPIVSRIEIQT